MKYTHGKSDPAHIKKTYNLKPGKDRKIPLIEEFFAVLVRLKVGLVLTDISSRLEISEGHFSKIFDTWIKFLSCELEALTRFPSLPEIRDICQNSLRNTQIHGASLTLLRFSARSPVI